MIATRSRVCSLRAARVAVLLLLACSAPTGAAKMYWTDEGGGSIRRANLDGSSVEELLVGLEGPAGLALDLDSGAIYWSERASGKIRRAAMDGSGAVDLVVGLVDPFRVALDLAGGRIYWTSLAGRKIRRAALDGSNVEDLLALGFEPEGLALDLQAGRIYWSDDECLTTCQGVGEMHRAELANPAKEDLFAVFVANSLELDLAASRIYWTSAVSGAGLRRAGLEGSNLEILSGGAAHGVALDLAAGKVYWTRANLIRRADLDGANPETVLSGTGEFREIELALCPDADGDGFCAAFDCDDTRPACTIDCTDADGDGFCGSLDCDDTNASCAADCSDADGDGLTPCDGDCDNTTAACTTDCTDADGDGLAVCAGDCDDTNPSCTTDCTDADGDGFCATTDCDDTNPGCRTSCTDADGDGFCVGIDCDDALASCTTDCTDGDGDGIAVCAGDCDDANPGCGTSCVDQDGDGTCPPLDCDDANPFCTSDCTDADGDGFCPGSDCNDANPNCTTDCNDVDGDGYCAGTDCDDSTPACTLACVDADGDGVRVCDGDCDDANAACNIDCTDSDGDGFCAPADCDDADPDCAADCADGDGDGVTVCDGDCDNAQPGCITDCTDADGDGLAACAGDCDDLNPSCTTDCTDADGDGFCAPADCDDASPSCGPDCTDADGDGLRLCDGDCDDANPQCTTDCTDADADGFCTTTDCDDANLHCTTDCTDADGDGYCVTADCDETTPQCTADCTDADGDGYCVGPDCLDSDPRAHPDAREVCTDGIDTDCDGADDATDGQCTDLSVAGLQFGDGTTLTWTAAAAAAAYALYRGDVPTRGLDGYNHRCEATEIAGTTAVDRDVPRSGEGFYYLVGGMSIGSFAEGTPIDLALGLASDGTVRPDSSSTTCGRRVYVDPDLLVSGDGLSWAGAYTRVATALLHQEATSRSIEVWVRGTDDSGITFDGAFRPGARLLGGFAGSEGAAWERSPSTSPTVLDGNGSDPALTASGVDLVLDGITLRNASTGVTATLAGNRLELTHVTVESVAGYGLEVTAIGGEVVVAGSTFGPGGLGAVRAVAEAGTLTGAVRGNVIQGGSDAAVRLEARPADGDATAAVDVLANRIQGGLRGIVLGAHVDDGPWTALQSGFVASNVIHDTTGDAVLVEASGTFQALAAPAAVRAVPCIVGNTISDGSGAGLVSSATRTDGTADPSVHEVRASPEIWDNLVTFHAGAAIAESADDPPTNLVADPAAVVGNDLFGNGALYLDEGQTVLVTAAEVDALAGARDTLESDPVYVDRPGRDYHIQFGTVLGFGDTMRYLANDADPGLGPTWTAPAFDDSSWASGLYGVGHDTGPPPNAQALLLTTVPAATRSVFTRIPFVLDDAAAVTALFLGADYDSGWAAWINGVEVFRSATLPAGPLDWDTVAAEHESSNSATPVFEQHDVSNAGIPLLVDGTNVLAVAVWSAAAPAQDLVLVPRLVANDEYDVIDAGHLDAPRIAAQDLDGQPRVDDGNADGIARPDVGADERR